MQTMRLDPRYVRPEVLRNPDPSVAERTYLDTLQALADSLRSDGEMTEAAGVLGPMLDARLSPHTPPDLARRLDETSADILKAALGARDARSGMGVDLCLDLLRLGLDDARTLTAEALG